MVSMLLWSLLSMAPAAGVYALEAKPGDKSGDASQPQAAEGQVVVMYEDGAVDTSEPETRAEKNSAKKARKSKAFGLMMSEAGSEDPDQAENTLGQQGEILSETLGSDYVIEDTVVLDSGDGSAAKQELGDEAEPSGETVVSTVSSDKYSADELAEMLSKNDKIYAAEPNYIFHAAGIPDWNDTFIQESWQNAEKGVNADSAWNSPDFDRSEKPIIIAVLDTGIDYEHEDLADRMWTEPEGFKLKGNHGMDFVYKDDDPMDENGHGTHCAGIIAAAANNEKGVAGIAGPSQKIQLMSARVLDEEGSGTFEDIVSAFYYLIRAKKAGADIRAINCSLGASVSSDIFSKVIDKAGENGILTIAAAGNETSDNDQVPSAPANCNSEYVISVAALDDNGELASYSNYGKRNVDVAAPGSNILSTVSYYNYAPYLYDNDRIGKTTEYYGEFGGAELIEETNEAGEVTQRVMPVLGTDYNGDPVTSAGTFGESVMISDLGSESSGKATLELTDSEDASFNIGNNKTTLRWKITGAKNGDTYVLYFPYEKLATGYYDNWMNMVFRTHTDGEDGGYGELDFGDIISYVDKNGKLIYRTVSSESFFGFALPVSEDWNSIWQASGSMDRLYSHFDVGNIHKEDETGDSGNSGGSEVIDPKDDYGLGFVYTAQADGDIYVDISSLAVGKGGAKEEDLGKYDVMSGTSMATPAVTGSVALLAAMNPDLSAADLRDKLYETTHGGYAEYCSTGGAVDFANYASEPANAKPVISGATCDFDKKTVTLTTKNAGTEPEVSAEFNFADKTVQIPSTNLSVSDGKITISDKEGLIGSQVTFNVRNTQTGLEGQKTLYLVKGLKEYKELFTMDKEQEEEEIEDWSKGSKTDKLISASSEDDEEDEEDPVFPAGMTYIKGANKYLLYDATSIYKLAKNDDGRYEVTAIGKSIEDAVNAYAKKKAKTDELWAPDDAEKYEEERKAAEESGDEEALESSSYYTTTLVGEPACIGNTVYVLVNVDFVDRESVMVLGLDMANKNKWTVYYDSLGEFGSEPADMKLTESEPTVASYKGKLYVMAAFETVDDGKATGNSKVYSCTLSAKGSKWEKAADMSVPVKGGKALAQGGSLYYFLGSDDENEIDYNVYKFDGSKWSEAGKLPVAVYKGGGADPMALFFGIFEEDISCAYGIDEKGLIFAGRSFDGAGDTFRFNTSTGKIDQLGYSLWGDAADRVTDGTVAGGKLLVQYDVDEGEKTVAKTIPIKTGYVNVTVKKSGKGSGTVKGSGSYPKGESAKVEVTPAKGCYIYQISTTNLSPNVNKKYGKSTKASKATYKATFKGAKDAVIKVHFGKVSTKLTVQNVKKVKVGKRKIKAYTDGTINGVTWKSSKKKFAKVNKDGSITFKKAGIGKTVKLTATSKENSKLKKTIKVKIKGKKKAKKKGK